MMAKSGAVVEKAQEGTIEKRPIGGPRRWPVESCRHLLRGLWWSGLRLGEALNLSWDD